jgi:PhnB protein
MELSAHIVVPDASAAAAWYEQAFGARERSRIPLPGGTVMVVEVEFGGPIVLQLNVDDVDAAWARAVQAGASVHHELADAFWGERHGQLTDPFGHRWNLAQRIRDVPHDELVAAAARAFGGG